MKLKIIIMLMSFIVAHNALGMDPCHYCKKPSGDKAFISFGEHSNEQYFCCETCRNKPGIHRLFIPKSKLINAYGGDCPICMETNPDCLMRCCFQGCNLLHAQCYTQARSQCPMCRAQNNSVVLDKKVTTALSGSVKTQTQNCPGCNMRFGLDETFIASSCHGCGQQNVCMPCAKNSVHKNKCSTCIRRLSETALNEITRTITVHDAAFVRIKDTSRMGLLEHAVKNKNGLNRTHLLATYPEFDDSDIDNAIERLKQTQTITIQEIVRAEGYSLSQARRAELQQKFQWCDVDRLINEPVRNMRLVRSMQSSAVIISIASSLYAIISLYGMLSRTKNIDMLNQSARIAQDTLLSLDFDLFNPPHKLQAISKQYDIPAVLSQIPDTELCDRLEKAIVEFDTAFEAAYTAIATSYYYHPAAYFLEKETALVTRLELAQTQLRSVIDECKQQKKVGMRDFMVCGAALGVSAACGYYCAKANPLKKWGLF